MMIEGKDLNPSAADLRFTAISVPRYRVGGPLDGDISQGQLGQPNEHHFGDPGLLKHGKGYPRYQEGEELAGRPLLEA